MWLSAVFNPCFPTVRLQLASKFAVFMHFFNSFSCRLVSGPQTFLFPLLKTGEGKGLSDRLLV